MSTKSGIFNWSMFKSSWLTDKLWFFHLYSLPYLCQYFKARENLCLTYTCSGQIVLSLTFPSVSYFSCLPMLHKSIVRNMVAHLNNVLKSHTRIISTVFTTQMLALERSSLWTALLTQKWFANLSPLPCLHPQQMVQQLPLCAQENSWNQMECRFVLKNSVFSRRTLCLHWLPDFEGFWGSIFLPRGVGKGKVFRGSKNTTTSGTNHCYTIKNNNFF